MSVITRFAPSPTGYLHIGGARTALFNWLFARARGGKFLLRIEDTDHERSTQAAVDAIFDGLNWLGLGGDEPPLMQSERADRHREVALELVARGAAYRCPVTMEELDARRERAAALKSELEAGGDMPADERAAKEAEREQLLAPFRSPWRDPAKPLPEDAATVVRLRMPDEGELAIRDHVQGDVRVKFRDLDDLILLRSDGSPTYMLAVVVDDHDMSVTHVIRGDDHLNNTFRQMPIMLGMGWPTPEYAHVPMIHGPDGKKLSKRHGALGVDAYRDMGYLPEALKNYLLRLGWSHGDAELISEQEAIGWFSLEALNKAPARLDVAKLNAINSHYMAQADDERIAALWLERPEAQTLSEAARQRYVDAIGVLKLRAPTIAGITEAGRFLGDLRPIQLTGKAAEQMTPEARSRLAGLTAILSRSTSWLEPDLKERIAQYCAENNIGMGKIGPILRSALTGGANAPDISLVLALLGRNESLERLADQSGAAV